MIWFDLVYIVQKENLAERAWNGNEIGIGIEILWTIDAFSMQVRGGDGGRQAGR